MASGSITSPLHSSDAGVDVRLRLEPAAPAAGHVVRLPGFRFQRSDTVDVVGRRQRITLLVVPPEASPQRADDALDAGGDPGNTGTVDALLDPHPTGRK